MEITKETAKDKKKSGGPQKAMAKRLWHMVRAVCYMLRRSILKRKLMMNLNFKLLLERGKHAGKAISEYLITFNNNNNNSVATSSFSCRSMDPATSYYSPINKEVEFSCSNTPSIFPAKRKNRRHRYEYDVAAISKAFEILNAEMPVESPAVMGTPSPVAVWGYGKSPAVVKKLRVTDSPFQIMEEEEGDGDVDNEAEEFIRRFYEQLRLQSC